MEGLTHDYVPMYAYSKVLSFNSFDVRSLIYETVGKHGTEYKRSSQIMPRLNKTSKKIYDSLEKTKEAWEEY